MKVEAPECVDKILNFRLKNSLSLYRANEFSDLRCSDKYARATSWKVFDTYVSYRVVYLDRFRHCLASVYMSLEGLLLLDSTDDKEETNLLYVTEIQKTQAIGKPLRDQKYVDIYREKPIRVAVKVLVPVREHPKVIH